MSIASLHTLTDNLWRSAMGVIFPPCCGGCGAALQEGASGEFCGGCRAELPLIEAPACHKCGAPAAGAAPHGDRCPHCDGRVMRFDCAVAAGVYDGLLRRLVLSAKQAPGDGVSAVLGRMAARAVDTLPERPDVVTCVPMHWRRRLLRQHNSPEVIGDAFARTLGVPFDPRVLGWRRATRKQADLSMTDRRRNVRGALAVRPGYRLRGATVAVVDDVLTTGATCSEAARALKRAGAVRVLAVVAARSL